MSAYATLERRFKRLFDIEGAAAILNWDQAVMMPKGGNAPRGEQTATLAGLAHEILTAPETEDAIGQAGGEALDDWQRANLREMDLRHRRATALPGDLVESLARATTLCEMAWREARPRDDFQALRPRLEEVVRLVRAQAAALGERLGLDPYDALLDLFQPGLKRPAVDAVLDLLAEALPPRVEAAMARQAPLVRAAGPFPVDRQRALVRDMMRRLGFDFDHGRLDESAHPFCGGVPGDVRITTRYRDDDVTGALMGVLHETGHALYEGNLPPDWRAQPVGAARGMTVHESQSLLVEMQACRGRAFLAYLSPLLQARFGPDPAFEPAGLTAFYHRVERGLIRVDADEITYPLHVILRYRLERALIDGGLAVRDLPGAWRDGMRGLLGVTPDTDREGCLQDIHWPTGAFGYFPSYTLGAVLAAQLFKAAKLARPSIPDELVEGRFDGLMGWLKAEIHAKGSLLPMDDLIVAATGKPLSADDFLAHLDERYA
ncbi:MAG: carboxypeptidase M32 [Geminicoccaceae bacterium]|nr:carboxypeptidase M32 [Geminicoccaceae bacterium]